MKDVVGPDGRLWLAAALALMAAIAVLSLIPGDPQPGDSELVWLVARVPPDFQDAMHVVLYLLLGFLWFQWLAVTDRNSRHASLALLGAILAFGIGLEALQLLVPGRFANLGDAGRNVFGTLAGALISRLFRARGASSSSSPDAG